MIRLILIFIVVMFVLIYSIPEAIICFFISKVNKRFVINYRSAFIRFFFKVFIFISGARISIEGLDNINLAKEEKSIFIISNHRGFFDTVIGYSLLKFPCGIVAKNSLLKVPLLSYWMKNICCLFLDRDDIRSGVKMVLDAIKYIDSGISMWVFPEGTRNKNVDPSQLLEFKAGAFKIPEKTNCKILPIAFINTEKLFENQIPRIKPADVKMIIGKMYTISEINASDATDLANKSSNIIKDLVLGGSNG